MPSIDWAWVDVAVPHPSQTCPGIRMAGFHQRADTLVDITMVAHPAVTVIIDLTGGGGFRLDHAGRRQTGSAVIGLAPRDLRASGGVGECLQIRLDPAVAAIGDLGGGTIRLEDLWGRNADRAEDRLRSAATWTERFTIAAAMIGPGRVLDPEVAHVWRTARKTRGRLRVEALADEVGWSRKRLWSRFRSQLGMSPKQAVRLIRFDHAAHLLAAGRPPATVAVASGYTDQSHLHRDVRDFTGQTPARIAAAPWLAIDPVAWPSR
ncbi:helix-turn-helix domain-containing protein [Actinoplanes sp. NPDC023714]|uniref:helix-turn-helix domain-containing protein n=1 Tax=Actinoplanes sp. NPDC023714 TaxID=3154322 RepID=UPI0033FFB34B